MTNNNMHCRCDFTGILMRKKMYAATSCILETIEDLCHQGACHGYMHLLTHDGTSEFIPAM